MTVAGASGSAAEPTFIGLHASTPEELPFAPGIHIRAFLLQREQGNLLVYSTTTLAADRAASAELGGVSRQYLHHSHEAMFAAESIGAPPPRGAGVGAGENPGPRHLLASPPARR